MSSAEIDNHPAATSGADPILRHGDCLGGAGARRIDLRVGTAGADQLGELRVPHGQHAEQEAPVELERLPGNGFLQVGDATVDLLPQARLAVRPDHAFAQVLEHGELIAPGVVGVVARHFVGEGVVAREDGGEDHAGVVAQGVGQSPSFGQLRARGGALVTHGQRDTRVAQGVDAGRDGQAGDAVERLDALRLDAELLAKIERAAARRELDHVSRIPDLLEGRASVVALHQARDVLVQHRAPEARRNGVNELLAAQDPGDVAVIEDVVGPRQSRGTRR